MGQSTCLITEVGFWVTVSITTHWRSRKSNRMEVRRRVDRFFTRWCNHIASDSNSPRDAAKRSVPWPLPGADVVQLFGSGGFKMPRAAGWRGNLFRYLFAGKSTASPDILALGWGLARKSANQRQARSVVVSSWPSRPVAGLPARTFRLDAGFGVGSEVSAAPRAELGSVPDHADGDTVDVRNVGTAKTKRVAAARLLLLLSIGVSRRWPHRKREHGGQHRAELELSGASNHCESPKCFAWRTVCEGRRNRKKHTRCNRNQSWESRPLASVTAILIWSVA